jgi:hypothetical protein
MDSRYNESLNAWLANFLRKEAAEKEAAEQEAVKKVAAEVDDDNSPISPIRFSRVMHLLKCLICLNYLYEHKNGLLFHIKRFIKDEMSPQTWSNNISIFLGFSICNHE